MSNSLTKICIVIVSIALYALCLKAIPGNINSQSESFRAPFQGNIPAYELSHERSSYATLVALDKTGRTDLGPELADAAAPDVGYLKGKFYSYFPPGLAFSAWPVYTLGKHFGYSLAAAYFMVSIFAAIGLILIYKVCFEIFKFPRWLALFVTFSTGFASTYFNFSITFYQHVPNTLFLLLGFYSAWRYGKYHNWLWAAICWSCYGMASFFDFPNLILYLPVLAYLVYQGLYSVKQDNKISLGIKNSLIISSVFLMILGAAHMYYNHVTYGNWSQFSNTLPSYNPRREGLTLQDLEKTDTVQVAAEKAQVSFALKETNLAKGFYVLLFEFDKSLLIHMPIFLLALLGIYSVRKKINMEVVTVLLIIGVNLLLYSSFHDPWGGWGFGPRYLVTSMPFINILVGLWLMNAGWIKRLFILPIVMYSAGVAILGAVTKNFLVPNVEVLPYNLPYKIWSEFKFLKMNQNGTFVYNEYLAGKYSLTEYFIALWIIASLVFLVILFILPYTKYGNKTQ